MNPPMSFEFLVPGPPVGKERPRRGKYGNFYTPQKTKAYEEQIRAFLKDAYPNITPTLAICYLDVQWRPNPYDGEEELFVTLTQTDDLPRKKLGPDGDNILKVIADALNGIAYKDDSQIDWWSFQRTRK